MITDDLTSLIHDAIESACATGDLPAIHGTVPINLEAPRNKQHGDYSSNVALLLKKATAGMDSRHIAACIQKHLNPQNRLIDHTDVAGPGFLNFYLKPDWLHDILRQIERDDTHYGFNTARSGERILIEFVSANPTGPISVVNGRAAALGDVLANLLASQGCTVAREFYINDALNSTQLDKFAESVMVRYLQQLGHPVVMPTSTSAEEGNVEPGIRPRSDAVAVAFPADGYPGDYVKDIARAIKEEVGDAYAYIVSRHEENATEENIVRYKEAVGFFKSATLKLILALQRAALESFGVQFDSWFFESSLYASGAVDHAIETLKQRGYAYEQDGALWLRSSALGDTKDRVLVRSNEKATYVAADCAYHQNKFERGFTHLINIWGADHHGYVARLKAGVAALGFNPDDLEIVLTQMVSLVRDGEAVIGGKRKGVVIELKEDLVDEIGKDAARFYFLLNSYETPAAVDIEMAKRQSNENPVYYVQYAHARLCNILRRAFEENYALNGTEEVNRSLLVHPAELDVLRKLADYPDEVTLAAKDYAPHRLPRYAMEMASLLNVFYENCRVLPGRDEPVPVELTNARLSLVNGSRIVISNLLTMLGVSAPDSM